MSATVPVSFALIEIKSPFVTANGPFYYCVDDPDLRIGLLTDQRHCNAMEMVHGGMMATIADFAMGRALGRRRGPGHGLVTLNLNLDYIGAAGIHAWLEAQVQLKKEQGNIVFATCDIRDGERIVLTASGVFKFVSSAGAKETTQQPQPQ